MIGKIIKLLLIVVIAGVILAAASIGGVYNDKRTAAKKAEAEKLALEEEAKKPKEVSSPFDPYTGGMLDLQMDYEAQSVGDDISISIVSNLPDGYDLTGELSNVEEVKKQLGYENISASALTPEQMNEINEQTYNSRQKNFVTGGVCTFLFKTPPTGQLDLKVTSPITSLQSSAIQELLGDKGANLQGSYVVFLEEVGDKSINYTVSFIVEDDEEPAVEEPAVEEAVSEGNSEGEQ